MRIVAGECHLRPYLHQASPINKVVLANIRYKVRFRYHIAIFVLCICCFDTESMSAGEGAAISLGQMKLYLNCTGIKTHLRCCVWKALLTESQFSIQ
jgi:hypothetical protein